jgi:RNA polymerase sigma-70 factor (ECF subfamily)
LADIERENESLLRRLSGGDSSAFWALWLQNKDYLYRICLQLMRRSPEDAEDVLSGAMLKAVAKMSAHAGKIQDARAWLAQLTRNYCIDIHRQRQREIVRLDAVSYGQTQTGQAGLRSNDEEQRICLDSALKNLPANQKEVIVFRFIGGKSYEEIAAHLNVSPTAVRKRIQRARIALKQMGVCAHSTLSCSCDGTEHVNHVLSAEWYCVAILRREDGCTKSAEGVVDPLALLDATPETSPSSLPLPPAAQQNYCGKKLGSGRAAAKAVSSATAPARRPPASGLHLAHNARGGKVHSRRGQAVDAAC